MLEEQISKDYIAAMKAKDKQRSATLSFLRAQLKNVHIEKKTGTLGDNDVIAVIKKQVKQRQDSVAQYKSGGRQDLADQEQAEMDILRSYLPEELSEEALRAVVKEVVQAQGATSVKDMGRVMKAVLAQVEGRADSRMVSELVKDVLANA